MKETKAKRTEQDDKTVIQIDDSVVADEYFFLNEQERAVIYYIYPKMKDVQKLLIIIMGMWLGYSIIPTFDWKSAVAAFICIEVLLYAARYQLNDILGLGEYVEKRGDRCVVIREKITYRGFPLISRTVRNSLKVAVLMMLMRFILSFILLVGYFGIKKSNIQFIICYILIVVSTVGYEYARTGEDEKAYWVIILVGFGYPLRLLAGFFAVVGNMRNSFNFYPALLWVAVGMYFYGTMSALLPWMFEVLQEGKAAKKKHYQYFYNTIKEVDSVKQYFKKYGSGNIDYEADQTKGQGKDEFFNEQGDAQRKAIIGISGDTPWKYIPWKRAFVFSIVCFANAILCIALRDELTILSFIMCFNIIVAIYLISKRKDEVYSNNGNNTIENYNKRLIVLLVILAVFLIITKEFVYEICVLMIFVIITYIFLCYLYNPYYSFEKMVNDIETGFLTLFIREKSFDS